MKIDLKTLKAGDEVLVKMVVKDTCDDDGDVVLSAGYSNGENRTFCRAKDIVEIIPKAFDWSEVENGDAFLCGEGKELAFYVGESPHCQDIVYLETGSIVVNYKRGYLTRSPEKDIPNA